MTAKDLIKSIEDSFVTLESITKDTAQHLDSVNRIISYVEGRLKDLAIQIEHYSHVVGYARGDTGHWRLFYIRWVDPDEKVDEYGAANFPEPP